MKGGKGEGGRERDMSFLVRIHLCKGKLLGTFLLVRALRINRKNSTHCFGSCVSPDKQG